MEALKDYFTRYPHNDEVFENKEVLFHTRGAADSYGNAADTKRYTRAQVMAAPLTPKGEQEDAEKAAALEAEKAAAKVAAIETLKETDVEVMDYNAMKALVKAIDLKTVDAKQATLKAALAEFKNALNAE